MAKLSRCKPWSTACTSAKYEDIYILIQRLFLSRPLRTAAVIVGRRPSASSDGDATTTTTTTSFSSKMTMWHYCPTYCLLLLFFLPPPRFARPPLAGSAGVAFLLPFLRLAPSVFFCHYFQLPASSDPPEKLSRALLLHHSPHFPFVACGLPLFIFDTQFSTAKKSQPVNGKRVNWTLNKVIKVWRCGFFRSGDPGSRQNRSQNGKSMALVRVSFLEFWDIIWMAHFVPRCPSMSGP